MNFANHSNYKDPFLQQRIAERLANLFTPVNRIDHVINSIVKQVMQHKIVPYFTDVITRHTEAEFHQKIDEGFDLVLDMKVNHPDVFWAFLRVARKFRNRLIFNEGVLLGMIVDIVQSKPYNWIITYDEQVKLFAMIHKLKEEIYS